MHNAIQKEGFQNFKVECLEEVPLDQLDERERYWIKKLDTVNTGYNISAGGKCAGPVDWARIQVVENGKVFDSLEDMGRIISSLTSWSLRFVKEKLSSVVDEDDKDFLGYHLIALDHSEEVSDIDELEDWVKTLSIKFQGKHIFCPELNLEFDTIGQAGQYILQNNLYSGNSKMPIQSIVTSIGKIIHGRIDFMNSTAGPLTFEEIPGKTTKQIGGDFESKKVYCPQLDKTFDSQIEAAKYFIDNQIWSGIKLKTARLRISDIVRGAFSEYRGYTFTRVEE